MGSLEAYLPMETAEMTNCLTVLTGERVRWGSKRTLTTMSISLILSCAAVMPAWLSASPEAEAASPGAGSPDQSTATAKPKAPEKAEAKKPEPVIENVQNVTAEQVVDKPHDYLNKNIKFSAAFANYTNVGLDYKPALKPAKSNLSFFVYRQGSHVPLSEMKLDMPIPKEKDPENTMLAQLKDGDTVEVIGHVFSTALDDPWVEVLRLKKTASAPEDKKVTAEREKEKKEKEAEGKKPESGAPSEVQKTPEQKPMTPKNGTKIELKVTPDNKTTPDQKKPDSSDKK